MMLPPILIWAVGFCCVCLLLYLCTFRSYLKGVKGSIVQLSNALPLASIAPKARNTAIFVIDVDEVCYQTSGQYLKNPTLNLEAIAKSGKPKADVQETMNDVQSSDTQYGRLLSREERECFTI